MSPLQLRLTRQSSCYIFLLIIIIIIIIVPIVPSRNIGCLWVLSTSVYRLLRTSVHPSFYSLPWLPIFSSYFSVFLSSCFPEGFKVGQPLVSLHSLFLMCDRSISKLHSRALIRQQIVSSDFLFHRLIENSKIFGTGRVLTYLSYPDGGAATFLTSGCHFS
jgi:hypothetical protein